MTGRFAATLLAMAMLTACATPVPPPVVEAPVPAPVPEPEPEPEPGPPPVVVPEQPRRDPLKHLANRDLKPMPMRPLNARATCNFRDVTGYRARMNLEVRAATVARFDARVDIPKHGSCQFALKDFSQTDRLPHVVLASKTSGCTVSLWEQGDQVTVAFRDCRSECSGSSADYLWPILVDNRKGSCS